VAARLGLPLMPWQQLVADVGGELDSRTGLPVYREVIVTVPRQSGKTTLVLGWEVQRAIGWDGAQRIAYSAQSGKDAREKLLDDQVPILETRRRSVGLRRVVRTNGSEAVEFLNGSKLVLLASSADSGHGKTLDLGVKDEFWADYDDRRDQALIPAMATRAAAQVLTCSTMGTDLSVPLNEAVRRGRVAVEAGDVTSGIAYFEWSAEPDEDPDDPETWWGCMPALGYTITERVVVHARATLEDGEFRRAFLNQQTKADERVIPAGAWDGVCGNFAPAGPLTFSLDVNPERSGGAIVAAGVEGTPTVELVDQRAGTGWLVDRAVELSGRHGSTRWVVDGRGPAGSLIGDLERGGLEVHAVSVAEMVEACGQFYDRVLERAVRVRAHPKLDAAAAAAAKRSVSDAFVWARKSAATDISPLVAVTLALWGATRAEESAATPMAVWR
jgi:hypothetical protein